MTVCTQMHALVPEIIHLCASAVGNTCKPCSFGTPKPSQIGTVKEDKQQYEEWVSDECVHASQGNKKKECKKSCNRL